MKTKLCNICGKKITGKREKLSYSKFCSNACYIKNCRAEASKKSHLRRKKQVDKVCVICEKKYTPIRFTQKTCSDDCRDANIKILQRKGRNTLTDKPCAICKKVFKPKNSIHRNCSPKCQEVDYHNKEVKRNAKRKAKRKNNPVDTKLSRLGILPTDTSKIKIEKHSNPKFCNSSDSNHSSLKDSVEEFISNGGKIERLPDEREWPMFPFNDTLKLNTKRILDYERDHKSRREETL